MALKIRNNANPDLIGDIQPGWSIDENATPHVIGDGSASVGGVQFSAARREDSEFLLNKDVAVYYEPEGTVATGNNVSGTVDSVDVGAASVGLTSTNKLTALTAERKVAPLAPGVAAKNSIPLPGANLGLSAPRGLDTDGARNVYISDTLPANSIYSYTPTGAFLRRIDLDPTIVNVRFFAVDRIRSAIYAVGPTGIFTKSTFSGNVLFTISDQSLNGGGVASLPSGDVLVSGGSIGAKRYNGSGVFIREQAGGGIMCAEPGGNYYSVNGSTVRRFNDAGTQLSTWAVPGLDYGISSAASDASGIYLVQGDSRSTSPNVLYKYSPTGTLLYTAVARQDVDGGLLSSFGIAINTAGEIVIGGGAFAGGRKVANYASASGAYLTNFYTGARDFSAVINGRGVVVSGGYIYTAVGGGNVISQHTLDGRFIRYFGDSGPGTTLSPTPYTMSADVSGNIYVSGLSGSTKIFTADGEFIRNITYPVGTAAGQVNAMSAAKFNPVDGLMYVVEPTRVQRFTVNGVFVSALAVPTNLNYNNITFDQAGNPFILGGGSVVKFTTVSTILPLTDTRVTSGDYTDIGVSGTRFYTTGNYDGTDGRYSGVLVQSTMDGALLERKRIFSGTPLVSASGVYADGGRIVVIDPARGAILSEIGQLPRLSTAFDFYLSQPDAGASATFSGVNPLVLYPGWTDSVWTKLNELCSATGKEIILQNDSLVVRDIATSALTIEDEFAVSKNLDATNAARSVEIVNYNATLLTDQVVFDYRVDAETTVSAGVGEVSQTSISTTTWLTSLQQPTIWTEPTGLYPDPGRFMVYSANGLRVTPNEYQTYGFDFQVSINPDGTSIDVTFTGPNRNFGLFEAPFYVASLVGDGRRTGISIVGSGVKTDPVVLPVATGADERIVSNDVSQSVDNVFITSAQAAYDRGQWAASSVNGVREVLQISLPVWRVGGLGISSGSIFTYKKAKWRVVSSTFANAAVSLTAEKFTTVGDHDAFYPGTIGQHDAALAALNLGETAIKPLY